MRKLTEWLWLSGLPRAADLAEWRPASVVDLTQRERPSVRRACLRLGLAYHKYPVGYDLLGAEEAVEAVLSAAPPVLVHCFHGRDRAPIACRRALMRREGAVVLHGVGRNLARAYRLCASFGVPRLETHACTGRLAGNLFSAAGAVELCGLATLPEPAADTVWLDQRGEVPLSAVAWLDVRRIVVGGETCGLPRAPGPRVRIDHPGALELTVEAALAIALQAWHG